MDYEKNIGQDAFADTPPSEQSTSNEESFSIDDILFGSGSQSDMFGTQAEEIPASQEVTPSQGQATRPQQGQEEVRYQYWQGQADKVSAENAKIKAELDDIRSRLSEEPQVEETTYVEESFPEPPQRPQEPRFFSREDAYADPRSESAQYLSDVEAWRDATVSYNQQKTDYALAKQREFVEGQRAADDARAQAAREQEAMRDEVNGVISSVQAQFGASEQEARAFVDAMASPDSLSIENLWKLYNLDNGRQQGARQLPSDSFRQTQRVQQVPSPMGVIPAANTNYDGRTNEDRIIDDLVSSFNGVDPFN